MCVNISLPFKSVDCFLRDFGSKSEKKYKAAYIYFTDCKCLSEVITTLSNSLLTLEYMPFSLCERILWNLTHI